MKQTRFILSNISGSSLSYATEIEGKLAWITIGIIDNDHDWWLTVLDPEGEHYSKNAKHDEVIILKVKFADKELTITCSANESDECFEICIIE